MTSIDPRYYYLTLILLSLCTLVGLIIAFRFQREVNEDLAPTSEKDLLDPLERAFYSGLMDEAEIQRIRESMGRKKAGLADPEPTKVIAKNSRGAGDAVPPPPPVAETEVDDD